MTSYSSTKNSEVFETLTSAEIVAANENLMVEIMIRLPVQSIITSKRISKHMRSLINSIWFVDKFHALREKQQWPPVSGIFFQDRGTHKETIFISLDGTEKKAPTITIIPESSPMGKYYILQSCNGLFLYSSIRLVSCPDSMLFVCNPTTSQSVQIPHPGLKPDGSLIGLGLAFDPTRYLEYTVVAIRKKSHITYCAEIYSSADDSKSWRPARGTELKSSYPSDPAVVDCIINEDKGVFVNGAIYWLDSFYKIFPDNIAEFIFSFDLREECLKPLKLPPRRAGSGGHYGTAFRFYHFGSCCNHLQISEKIHQTGNMLDHLVVYEMNTDASYWELKYIITSDDIPSFPKGNFKIVTVVQGETKDDRVFVIKVNDNSPKLIYHDAKNETSTSLLDCARYDGLHSIRWAHAFRYTENLYPVKSFTASDQ